MKEYLFNSVQISLLGFTQAEKQEAVTLFHLIVEELGMKIRPVYKPSELCDSKLIGGSEVDFIVLCDIVREEIKK